MSNLLVKPSKPDEHGRIHAITPASAGWTYVGFEVYQLKSGQSLRQATEDREACIVLLSGRGGSMVALCACPLRMVAHG